MFRCGSEQGQNAVLDLPVTSYIVKRFEMHQGCVFFDAESDGTIYFGLSTEILKLQPIFPLSGYSQSTRIGGKSPVSLSFVQID